MTILDGIILLLVVFSTLLALSQGFFYEVFNLAGVLVGYVVAAWEYPSLAKWLLKYVSSPWVADLAAFLTIFICIAALAGACGRIARWAVAGVGLRWFDRILGGAFGLVRGIAVSAILVMAMAAFAPGSPKLRDSALAPYFLVLGRTAAWIAPAELRSKFHEGMEILRNAREKAPALPLRPAASQ